MKKSITLAALLLALGTSVFAATTVKADNVQQMKFLSFS